jgi:hypothetical protein
VRFALTTWAAVLIAGVAAEATEPPSAQTVIDKAVQDFEPLWPPPRGALRGWRIGIDPAPAGHSPDSGCPGDDLGLLTAGYLYHFVRTAGGSPVLTRADNTTAGDRRLSARERRVEVIRRSACDACVSILYDEAGGSVAVHCDGEVGSDDARLAQALAAALGVEPDPRKPTDAGFVDALREAATTESIAVCEVRFGCAAKRATIDAALRKSCFDDARRLYEGISRFCEGAKRAHSPPGPPAGTDIGGPENGPRAQRRAQSIWPQAALPEEQVDWFCRRFAEISITNHSLVYFEVTAHTEDDAVVLRGRTNAPAVVSGLEKALRAAGVQNLRSEVQALPDRTRLGEQLFGVCRAPMALTYRQPEGGSVQTQLLFGEPVFLLDRDGEHYLLHAGDGYWGWVRREAIAPMTAEEFDAYVRHPSGVVLADIALQPVGIPRGSHVRVAQTTEDERTILLPDGSTRNVPAAAVSMDDPEDRQATARVRAALDLLYVPYVFGGCSPLGLDCSGLVANVWSRTGNRPARDAWQQALAGRLVATRWHRAQIQPGDQLFFINESGKISHTAVALDADRFIHAEPPCVQINSLDPDDPLYAPHRARTFFLAKRP